jgi:cellulose biosynthesis protein BcsQ
VEEINDRLGLVVGDLAVAGFEAELTESWSKCVDRREAAFRTVSAFSRIASRAANNRDADIVLLDVGPNLGAINRSALLAADFIVIPLAADLFSLQGLKNLGPTLSTWRAEWQDRLARQPAGLQLNLPNGRLRPLGYVVLQHAVRLDRPVKAYRRWMQRIPSVYRQEVLQEDGDRILRVEDDPHCLASLKNYRSLMPYSQDAHKPIFLLKPADGALGGHMTAVQNCYSDFELLAERILDKVQAKTALNC